MTYYKNAARLSLVGAGPGDPELITLKGIRILKSADVVLYDALVHPDLLKYAPLSAELIFVGKRAGKHSLNQGEICELIVRKAYERGHVVRLKGGDPGVFARSAEELDFAEANDIPVSIVPGISSALAVPAGRGIFLSRRDLSQSFWVMTGTSKTGQLSEDVRLAAQSSATIVILMGVGKLAQIAEIFRAAGRGNLPAALIQNGSLPNEKAVYANISELPEAAWELGVGAPGIIVIGETVRLSQKQKAEFSAQQIRAEAVFA